ncbi:MAG TPA: DUF3500 domain-containing protein [Pirellulales bacterium]|jgi:hypothetical protein|nr:DUF3500 domain-containing protein [Pirellulales bacterium]
MSQSNQTNSKAQRICPDCESGFEFLTLREFFNRRDFVKTAGTVAATFAAGAIGLPNIIARAAEATVTDPKDAAAIPAALTANGTPATKAIPETLVKQLYDSLRPEQREKVAFDWDYVDPKRGLLRTRVSNNWNITEPAIGSEFYSKDQQEIIRAIYEGLFQPEWIPKIDHQLQDDAGGYGHSQSVALFGHPGEGKFELVMTGRHLTVRVDGHNIDHMAFGGPVFHGHAASGFNEQADHPGNVFWPQAVAANKIFEMLDGKQRKASLQSRLPAESAVSFRGGDGKFPGLPVTELTHDQREQLDKTMAIMLSPYRNADCEDVRACLNKQGGIDKCSLAFYSAGDIGDDGVWDNWRLEGPSFVWYFRGSPHVHLWINIGDDSSVATNAQG